MKCCSQCDGIERMFDSSIAASELKDYRKNGPAKTTRLLIDTLRAQGVADLTLLVIGGGVGAIQHLLLENGVRRAVNVDASTSYIHAAQQEAQRLGHADRVTYQHGDFVNLAPEIEPVDIVTLDRVICCYPDMQALVGLSAQRAQRYYGVVFPQDAWWMKLARVPMNGLFRLQRNPFRFFVHPTQAVESVIHASGLRNIFQQNVGLVWQVRLYAR